MLAPERTRRDLLVALAGGGAAALLPWNGAIAAPPAKPRKLFAGTALARNRLAIRFEAMPPNLRIPDILIATPDGAHRLGDMRGAVRLVSLWAEWCIPCLLEMHDLAALRRRHLAAGLDVVVLHQGKKMTAQAARAQLVRVDAADLPSWLEPGTQLSTALATPIGADGFTLPCTVLLDRHGRVRGRAFGTEPLTPPKFANGKVLTPPGKAYLDTSWSLPAADAFARALAGGILDHI
ncbi:TlpA family protein disulfide reductase [Sphingomonas sp. ASY06-1R]|uniref:TlpA family protein disulfide reductase n=1 Tax=Sphingomonas sp. ASY06-1R TaxID=3445771 RepID=UPI003FA1DA4E